jgi:crossover junction endodeoxyribonuclease RusA
VTEFDVIGTPAPKGSTKSFMTKRGKIATTGDCKKEKPWSECVHWTAVESYRKKPVSGPLRVQLNFRMPRIQEIRKRENVMHIKKPDVDKLIRSVLDAITGVVWIDDNQVCAVEAYKQYADIGVSPGVNIRIWELNTER